MDYLDFDLFVRAADTNQLTISLDKDFAGPETITVATPFTAPELVQLWSTLEVGRAKRAEATRVARLFGEKLFRAVVSGPIHTAYLAARKEAGARGVRVRIDVSQAPLLDDWPWELLCDPEGDYLALGAGTPIVRRVDARGQNVRALVDVQLPLRALVIIANPREGERIDVEREWRALWDATAETRARGLLTLHRIEDGQYASLQRELADGAASYQVFHFIGHAISTTADNSGGLAFLNAQSGGTTPVAGVDVGQVLSQRDTVRLALLDTSQTPHKAQRDATPGPSWSGEAARDVALGGVPAVVAMQFLLSDAAASAFMREFYRALCEGYPVEVAVADARRAMVNSTSTPEWAAPTLFPRADLPGHNRAHAVPGTLLFPKRATAGASPGGMREALTRPPMLLGLFAVMAVIVGAVNLLPGIFGGAARPTTEPGVATLTPTSPNEIPNVDLAVDRLVYSPAEFAPGQPVSVSIRVVNIGTSRAGAFNWQWFTRDARANPPPTPALEGDLVGLNPGLKSDVPRIFRFPWWGTYYTSVYVNFGAPERRIFEQNIFNNFQDQIISTNTAPFLIDFSALPDNTPPESGDLTGSEYAAWGLTMNVLGENDCQGAGLKLETVENRNQITTGLPGVVAQTCIGEAVQFVIQPPEGITPLPGGEKIGSATIAFVPTAEGNYRLEQVNAAGAVITTETVRVNTGDVSQLQTITLTGTGVLPVPTFLVFRPARDSSTIIRSVTLALPE